MGKGKTRSKIHYGKIISDILGYARVSTTEQELARQQERLREVGAIKIFEDKISGKIFDRLGLNDLIAYARPKDLLCAVPSILTNNGGLGKSYLNSAFLVSIDCNQNPRFNSKIFLSNYFITKFFMQYSG